MKKLQILILAAAMCLLTGCVNRVEDGTELMEAGSYKAAADEFQAAIDDDKDVAQAYLGKGISYFELEAYPAAKQAFNDAISNGIEETPSLYNMLAICDMEQDNVSEAISSYQEGIALGDDADGTYAEVIQEMEYNLVVCYEKQRDWENAKAKMAEYIAKYPDDADAQKEAEFLETR